MDNLAHRIFLHAVDFPLSNLLVKPTLHYYDRKTRRNPLDPEKNGDMLLLKRIVAHIHAPLSRKLLNFIVRPGMSLTIATARLQIRFSPPNWIEMNPIAALVRFETENRRNKRPPSTVLRAIKTPTVDELYGRS